MTPEERSQGDQLWPFPYLFDLELTNRCNTHCAFCPRDCIRHPQGLMEASTLELFIKRLNEYLAQTENEQAYLLAERVRIRLPAAGIASPVRVVLCGMGESLLHPEAAAWVGRIRRETKVRVSIVTNGLLLDEAMVGGLMRSDVTVIVVSIPGIDRHSYERYMRLDWDTVLANVVRANQLFPGRIEISVTIPADAPFHARDVVSFWGEQGLVLGGISACHSRGGHFRELRLINASAGGSFCGVLARHNFVTWDGNVLSCCHDLDAANVVGSLRGDSFAKIAAAKQELFIKGPRFATCKHCNDDQRSEQAGIVRVRWGCLAPHP